MRLLNKPLVYFVQASESKRIKIGRITNGRRSFLLRLQSLQTGGPEVLTVLKISHDIEEGWAKDAFSPYRLHGEWFRPHRSLMNFIKLLPSSKFDGRKGTAPYSDLSDSSSKQKVYKRLEKLNKREYQTLELATLGKRNKEIARLMGVKKQTVKNQLFTAYTKIGIRNRRGTKVLLTYFLEKP